MHGPTYTAAQHNFGDWSFAIAMFIALVKAMFVILFFMHLWDQQGPNRLTMAIAVIFVLLLITLTLTDAATRFPLATAARLVPRCSTVPGTTPDRHWHNE